MSHSQCTVAFGFDSDQAVSLTEVGSLLGWSGKSVTSVIDDTSLVYRKKGDKIANCKQVD